MNSMFTNDLFRDEEDDFFANVGDLSAEEVIRVVASASNKVRTQQVRAKLMKTTDTTANLRKGASSGPNIKVAIPIKSSILSK